MIKSFFSKLTKYLKNKKLIHWLFSMTKPFIPSLLLLLFLGVITTLMGIASSVVLKYVIDAATSSTALTISVVVFIALTAAGLLISMGSSLITTVVNEKYGFHIRQKMFDRILRANWLETTKFHSGDLLTRLKSDVSAITGGITDVVPQIILLLVQLVAAFFTLYYYDASLALFALVLGPVTVFFSLYLGRKLKTIQLKVQESESSYSAFLQECIENAMIIKSFTAEERSSKRLMELFNIRLFWILKKNRLTILTGGVLSFLFSAGYIAALVWGAIKISMGLITFGTLTIFLSLVSRIQSPVVSLARSIPQIISILASAERLSVIIDLQQEEAIRPLDDAIVSVGLDLSNVNFGYLEDTVLDEAELHIDPGDIVAIVGPSGIGKTTLVRLIMSLIQPKKGEVSYRLNGGTVITAGPTARTVISYVPQGNTLFSGTIADNLRMGKPDATDEEMNHALRASAAEFVFEFSNGIETLIGERGHRLSEGQAQRVAIARALIRNSPFLILDEATSSLDEKTELHILQEIKNLRQKPTCIIITHRKSILAICNRKIQVDNKCLNEELLMHS